MEYGKWATYKGTRYMIVDWTENTVTLYSPASNCFAVLKSHISEVSDFMEL